MKSGKYDRRRGVRWGEKRRREENEEDVKRDVRKVRDKEIKEQEIVLEVKKKIRYI